MRKERMPEITLKKTPKKDYPMPKVLNVRARFIRTTPDKLRLVAKLVNGKKISEAIEILRFTGKAAARPLILVLKSGLAQAKDKNMSDDLVISQVAVDEGPKLKRRRIIPRGRATEILKRMSHITVVLSEQPSLKGKTQKVKGAKRGS